MATSVNYIITPVTHATPSLDSPHDRIRVITILNSDNQQWEESLDTSEIFCTTTIPGAVTFEKGQGVWWHRQGVFKDNSEFDWLDLHYFPKDDGAGIPRSTISRSFMFKDNYRLLPNTICSTGTQDGPEIKVFCIAIETSSKKMSLLQFEPIHNEFRLTKNIAIPNNRVTATIKSACVVDDSSLFLGDDNGNVYFIEVDSGLSSCRPLSRPSAKKFGIPFFGNNEGRECIDVCSISYNGVKYLLSTDMTNRLAIWNAATDECLYDDIVGKENKSNNKSNNNNESMVFGNRLFGVRAIITEAQGLLICCAFVYENKPIEFEFYSPSLANDGKFGLEFQFIRHTQKRGELIDFELSPTDVWYVRDQSVEMISLRDSDQFGMAEPKGTDLQAADDICKIFYQQPLTSLEQQSTSCGIWLLRKSAMSLLRPCDISESKSRIVSVLNDPLFADSVLNLDVQRLLYLGLDECEGMTFPLNCSWNRPYNDMADIVQSGLFTEYLERTLGQSADEIFTPFAGLQNWLEHGSTPNQKELNIPANLKMKILAASIKEIVTSRFGLCFQIGLFCSRMDLNFLINKDICMFYGGQVKDLGKLAYLANKELPKSLDNNAGELNVISDTALELCLLNGNHFRFPAHSWNPLEYFPWIVQTLVDPLTGLPLLGRVLLEHGHAAILQDFVTQWCDDSAFSKYMLAVSLLQTKDYTKAKDMFDEIISCFDDNGNLEQEFVGLRLVHQAIIGVDLEALDLHEYLASCVNLTKHEAPEIAIDFARTAKASQNCNNRPERELFWYKESFDLTLLLELNDETFFTISRTNQFLSQNPEYSETLHDMVETFIRELFATNRTANLKKYVRLSPQLFKKALDYIKHSPLVPDGFIQFLYTFHLLRRDYRKAAEVMYYQEKRILAETDPTDPAFISERVDCLLLAINAIKQVKDPKDRYILDDQERERSNGQCIINEDYLVKRYGVVSAQHILLTGNYSPEYLPGSDCTVTLRLLIEWGLFDIAFSLAELHARDLASTCQSNLILKPLFESLASRCIRVSIESPKLDDKDIFWLNANDVVDTNTNTEIVLHDASRRCWKLLESYLCRFDGEKTNFEYHMAVANRLLSENFDLQQWLIESFKEHNLEISLLEIYLTHGHIEEAAKIFMVYLKKLRKYSQQMSNDEARMLKHIPWGTMDRLLGGLRAFNKQNQGQSDICHNFKICCQDFADMNRQNSIYEEWFNPLLRSVQSCID